MGKFKGKLISKIKVLTPEFRVSFPDTFKARSFDESQEAKYSVTMLFDKGTDLTVLKKACKNAIAAKWPNKKPKKIQKPFRDAGEVDYDGYEEGMTFVRATSNRKPGVVGPDLEPITDEGEFYPGCYARATINAFCYSVKGNTGVSFGLQNVQKTRDGENFLGVSDPTDDFESLAEDEDSEDNSDDIDDDENW